MPLLPFGQYQPDVSDLNRAYTQSILNALPQGDGYGPFLSPVPYSAALPAPARGAFYGRGVDGGVRVFAGSMSRLYLLDNTTLTWTDVSKGGTDYAALDAEAQWSFQQFNNFVIASQNNDDMQVFDVSTGDPFDDLSGDAPRAAYIAIVNRYLVAAGIDGNLNRVHWCALNDVTNWVSLDSDFQDLPDGGAVRGVRGGEFGVIVQSGALRRMIFVPGSDAVFQIDRIADDTGSDLPWAITEAGGQAFFISQKGFTKFAPDGGITPIGEERVNRTFRRIYDPAQPQLVMGAINPDRNQVLWAFKTLDAVNTTAFNRLLVFDYVQNKWAPIELEGQCFASVAQSGYTLESLGTIGSVVITGAANNGAGLIRLTVASTASWSTGLWKDVHDVGGTTEANGTWLITVIDGTHVDLDGSAFSNAYTSGGYVAGSVDDLPASLDDFSTASLPKFAVFDTSNRLCFLEGPALEATLETSEQSGGFARTFCSGFMPQADAPSCFGSLGGRENMKATTAASYTAEQEINDQGFIPARLSTRHMRAKLRIPAGEVWTFATGAEPIYEADGER